MYISLAWVAAIAAALTLSRSTGLAQSAPRAPYASDVQHSGEGREYKRLIGKGIVEFNLAHWNEAKAFFLRAHALSPSARTLRSLGLVSYEQRNYVDALNYLQQSLTSTARPLTTEMRADVATAIEEATSFIGRVMVKLEPPDASLREQGERLVLPPDGVLLLDPGVHELSAERKGFERLTRIVRISGGEQRELQLRLSPIREASPATRAEPSTSPVAGRAAQAQAASTPDTSWWSSLSAGQRIGFVIASAGVLGLGIGSMFAVLAVNENAVSNRTCDAYACDELGRQHRFAAQARADVATVAFVTAGVLLATGGALLLFGGSAQREQAAAALAPILSPRAGGLAYRGRF